MIEFVERFVEAAREDRFKARDFVIGRSRGRADHAGQAQDGGEIGIGLDAVLLAQVFDRSQIGGGDFLIHGDGGRSGELVAHRDVEMAAADTLANDLADARFERLKPLGHA